MTCLPWLVWWYCASLEPWQVRPIELGLVVGRAVYPPERRCAIVPGMSVRTGHATDLVVTCSRISEVWYLQLERCREHRPHFDGKESNEGSCWFEREVVRVTRREWDDHEVGMRFSRW